MQGFEWVNEARAKGDMHPPKWGFTALKAGSTVSFLIDTRDATRGGASSSSSLAPSTAAEEVGGSAGRQGGVAAGNFARDDIDAGFMQGRNSSSLVEVSLAYLRSYEHMGMANISCSGEDLLSHHFVSLGIRTE